MDEFTEIIDIHCKGRYPREFGKNTKRSFIRNEYAINSEMLARMCQFFNYKDCFASVYSFKKFEFGEPWDRNSVIIDRIYIDLDYEKNLQIPLKEAQKIINWYSRTFGVYPLVYFSGYKGFAIYLDFKPIKFENTLKAKETLRLFMTLLIKSLNLKTADIQVTIDVARLSRLPLTINTKSNLYCTPLNPKKLDKLQPFDIIHMSKYKIYHKPEIEEAPEFNKILLELSELSIQDFEPPKYNYNLPTNEDDIYNMILNAPYAKYFSKNMLNRVLHYTKVAIEKGSLSDDPTIAKIHSKSKHFEQLSKNGNQGGATEHLARLHHLILLLLLGLTDQQIHRIFSHFHDYDPEKTQYFIDYNRKRLHEYLKTSYFLKIPTIHSTYHQA